MCRHGHDKRIVVFVSSRNYFRTSKTIFRLKMLLSARFLNDVSGVNSFDHVTSIELGAGDPSTVYFQLVDASVHRSEDGYRPAGRRYVPAAGATLQVVLENIDDAKKITRYATQPYAQDPSIWALSIQASDAIEGTVPLRMTLNESGTIRHVTLRAALYLRVS